MSDDLSPLVARRRLRQELRSARTNLGQTQEQVAKAMDWSLSKLIRIESGSVGISTNDLKALLRHFDITGQQQITKLLMLGRLSRERPWWSFHREYISPELGELIDYEAAASTIRSFQPLLIPGLLQTAEYAHAVVAQFRPEVNPDRLDRVIDVRMTRQKVLDRDDAPEMAFILDEAALRRWIGGRDVMRRQIEYLASVASRHKLSVEVVPFDAGVHPGLQGPFVILDFADEADASLLYLEISSGEVIKRGNPEDYAVYLDKFEQLSKLSLGPAESVKFLNKIAAEMR